MIADLKPYAEYKESGSKWLGDVPQHWSVVPNRAVFAEVKDRDHPEEEMLSVTITRGIVKQETLLEGSSRKDSSNLDKSAYKLVQPRDIAYNKMRAWQGAIGVSDLHGIISPAYVVMRLRNADDFPSYFHHLYRTPQFAKEAERWSYGITSDMWSLRPEHFKMIYSPEPPPHEQAAIVRFLDWARARLERAIRAKRKVIALLNEQKQAIIHRAVTRGLVPSVTLRPSGLEWLGDVPAHWSIARASSVAAFISAKAHEQFVEEDGEHICVTARFVSTGGRKFRRCTQNFSPAQRGDVLMVMSDLPRGRALGRSYLVNDDRSYAVNQRVCILRPKCVHPSYLAFAADRHAELLAHDDGSNQTHLPNAAFKIMHLALPPHVEQEQIADSLVRTTSGIEARVERTEREIDLLREYCTRLVADVVTGKLDVREAAARLPDEAPPDAIEDDADLSDETETADEEIAV